jgi:hypothetical protein
MRKGKVQEQGTLDQLLENAGKGVVLTLRCEQNEKDADKIFDELFNYLERKGLRPITNYQQLNEL